jgi:predicted peptidase
VRPKHFILSIIIILLFGCSSIETAQYKTGQRIQYFQPINVSQKRFGYLLFLPRTYNLQQEKKWPLIIFLHGRGEWGSDVEKVKKNGIPKLIENEKDFPFVVISPQCPENEFWPFMEIRLLLNQIIKHYRIDTRRIYLTGISWGGAGTWELGIQTPNTFAAIAPVAGWVNPQRVSVLKNIPIWIFHGEKDTIVPPNQDIDSAQVLKGINANVKITIFSNCDHDIWDQTYNNQELYDWFLEHENNQFFIP